MTRGEIESRGALQQTAIQHIEMLPTASFGRKDGLAYLLSASLLPVEKRFSLDECLQTLQSAEPKKFVFPSHSLEVLSLADWATMLAYKSKVFLQVTAGPELAHYKMQMLDVLDLGFSVQIWFDNPRDYRELCECWQSLYPGQVFLCFLPNKSFDYQYLLNDHLKNNLQVLFLPKQSSLDSRLNFEEILWFKQAMEEKQVGTQFVLIPETLTGLPSEQQEFFQHLSYEALQHMLLRKNKFFFGLLMLFRGLQKLQLRFVLDVLKQVLLFFANPTLRGSQAIFQLFGFKAVEMAGSVKVTGVHTYWGFRHLGAYIQSQFWEFHRGPYQYLWKLRRAFVVLFLRTPGAIKMAYWSFYRGPWTTSYHGAIRGFWRAYGFFYQLVTAVYFAVRNLPGRLRSFSWKILLRPHQLFWLIYGWSYRGLVRVFWRIFSFLAIARIRIKYRVSDVFYWSKFWLLTLAAWLQKAIVLGSTFLYVRAIRLFFQFRGFLRLSGVRFFYLIYSSFGRLRLLLIRLFYLSCSGLSALRIFLFRVLTKMYWTLTEVRYWPQAIQGIVVRLMWALHRGPYQILVRIPSAVQAVFRRIFWFLHGALWSAYGVSIAFIYKVRGQSYLIYSFFGLLYGFGVRIFWWWHRGPYQLLWKLRLGLQYLAQRIYWRVYGTLHLVLGFLAFVLGYARFVWSFLYWQVVHRLWYVIRFPFFKIYWFMSYQFKKRILKRVATSESPV